MIERAKGQGANLQGLVDVNETYKTNVKYFLSVNDLNHLIKSGRLTNASAFIGFFTNLISIFIESQYYIRF
ncbi:DegV family protein [Alkaliphilus metalliredigens]|uniref:DegV family protein n=1 Tax=Alkaliphilus metalliredigens TaxID=208226 RepID=UPI001F602EE3|nr:DegV family protein [Alkaliphilus metalliredigens]